MSPRSVLCFAFALGLLAGLADAEAPATQPAAKKLFDEGRALAAAHDHQGAIDKYAQSLADDPNQADVHAYKAASHLALGQFDPAQQEAEAAMKIDPRDFRFHEITGQIKVARNRIPEGRALYDQAAKLSPASAGAIYTDLAAALAERNDPALTGDIDAALKAAAAADPPGADALFQLGQSYANAGKQEGKVYLQRYLDVSAKLPEAQQDAQKMQVARQLIRALDILRQEH
jgi:tetratricopeptide (TPR) repeat protein